MKPFHSVSGSVAVLDRTDVDTDQIIPKQFLKRIERAVRVFVVLVVHVGMRVAHRFVNVLVFMAFGQVQPHARRHEHASNEKTRRHRLVIQPPLPVLRPRQKEK